MAQAAVTASHTSNYSRSRQRRRTWNADYDGQEICTGTVSMGLFECLISITQPSFRVKVSETEVPFGVMP